jgi:hypothetical protein
VDTVAFANALHVVAESHERLIKLAIELRSDARVCDTSSGVDLRDFAPGAFTDRRRLFLNVWAWAELHDDTGRTWWLELEWDETRWTVEASVLINSVSGPDDPYREVRTAETMEELLEAVRASTAQLVAQPLPPCVPRAAAGRKDTVR